VIKTEKPILDKQLPVMTVSNAKRQKRKKKVVRKMHKTLTVLRGNGV